MSTADEPTTLGVCIDHGSVGEWYADGSGLCLYCCTVETSCACRPPHRYPRKDATVTTTDNEPAERLRKGLIASDELGAVQLLDAALAAERAIGADALDEAVATALRKVRERLTAHRGSITYRTAMLCVENTEAEYARLTAEGEQK